MATIRKTTYRCDACGAAVARKKDLRPFTLLYGPGSYRYGRVEREGIKAEFCDDCEARFVAAIQPFFGDDGVSGIRRDEA